MNKTHVLIAGLVVALLVGVGWAMGFFNGQDPKVVELEQLRDENFKKRDETSGDQRREQFSTFREKVGELTPEQRKQFFESSRPMFQKMMNERMDRFFTLSEEEQTQELDEMIDRMEERRKERESRDSGERGRDGGDWGNRGDMSPQQHDRSRQERLDRTTPELRAKFDRFRDLMNDRREARGLEPMSGPGFWRGRR